MSQKSEVLAVLLRGETITPRKAQDLFGCDRLGARIWTLIHKDGYDGSNGYFIDAPLIKVGSGKRVAQYKLRRKDGQLTLI
ncbi:MAG: hypothetical protein KAV87_50415 [Desulfobacteraceae bacterium]|nr:hypothetical protein [Desulfobacteraceae bacterium]